MREKIRDFGVKRVGRRGEMGRKWRKSPSSSGRLTFQQTAVLSQVLVLRRFFFFPALVIIWSRGISSRRRVSVSCGRKLKCTLREACDPLRNKLGVFNPPLVDSELSLNDFNGLRLTLEARRPCESSSFVYVFYVFLGNFMPSLELRQEVREDTQHKRSPASQEPDGNLEHYLNPPGAAPARGPLLLNVN